MLHIVVIKSLSECAPNLGRYYKIRLLSPKKNIYSIIELKKTNFKI